MAYYLNYGNQSIESPSITSLPNYVKGLMHTGVEDITLDIGDMDKTVFNALVDEIRLHFCNNSSYAQVATYENRKWTNPYYFHIPSEKDSAISFTEYEDKLEIHKADIEEVLKLVSDDTILLNELGGDMYGLRGIESYDIRKLGVTEQLEAMQKFYEQF